MLPPGCPAGGNQYARGEHEYTNGVPGRQNLRKRSMEHMQIGLSRAKVFVAGSHG